jgi:hypothetical protein
MTTTDKFQVLPDFYYTEKECKDAKYNKEIKTNTNPRYHNFNQIYFTAGDVDQFNEFRDPTNGKNPDQHINLEGNVWNEMFLKLKELNLHEKIKDVVENLDWPKYRNLSVDAVDNTFFYIFDKFKKGIFVKIKDNKLSVFLPFSKHNYTNEWSDRMKHDPSLFSDISHFLQYASKISGYNVSLDKINKFTEKWYGNNCLIRTEYPIMENDRGMTNVKDMLVTLCNSRKVPDIEFFINKRDYPLITKREFEPYEQIYDTENQQLLSHNYNTYSPILSMVTTDKHSDIPFPTHEDWARVSTQEDKKFFYPDCRDYKYNFEMDWDKKMPTAVFRGASTGCGVTVDTNPRLKASYLSTISPNENGYKFLDAGITKWNLRPRKIMGNKYLQLIEPSKLPFGLVNGLTPEEQSKYKYILNIDGHVTAFRLSLELSMGSVVLLTESKYRIWYMRYLKPGFHYIPVKNDLSDLFEKIRWCRDNDEECKKIANNAKIFYDTYLSKNGILDYLQYLLIKIKKTTGTYFYNTVKVEDLIAKKQLDIIKEYGFGDENKLDLHDNDIINTFNNKYKYYINEGLRLFLCDKTNNSNNSNKNDEKYETLHESKDTKILRYNNFIVKKITDDENRKKQLVNEAFCGLTLINELTREIPNFRYTYFINEDQNCIVSEYIEGVTLQQYINEGCNFRSLIKVLLMVNLALSVAQERFSFVHYDLFPWNIIIKKVEKRSIFYRVKHNIFKVETDIIPIIIDYGRSHVIYNNVHYGTIEQFKTKLFQDTLSLVVCCTYSFLNVKNAKGKRNIISDDVRDFIINMINFYSETEFLKNKINDYSQLCSFLDKNKKYNEMIFGNKCGLEEKDTSTFFYYLYNMYLENNKDNKDNVNDIIRYMYPQKPSYDIIHLNSLFFYKIIKRESPYYEIFKYLENIEMKYESFLSESKNIVMKINVCNMIDITVRDILKFIEYISSLNIKYKEELKYPTIEKLKYICDRILKRLEQKYSFIYINYEGEFEYKKDESILPLKYFYIRPNPIVARYTTKTFSIPDEILTILQGNNLSKKMNKIYDFVLEMRDIIIRNFLYDMKYKILNEQDEHIFMKNNKKYILFNPVVIYNDRANLNTIKMISNMLYKKEIKVLENMKNKPEKILLAFRNILNII